MKILLLEDDQLLNNAIGKFLTLKGHKVHRFRDGKSAKISIEKMPYDLLILDINVPYISGLTLFEEIQQKKIQIHTIFISAIIDIDDISRAFDLGCHDYLKKPFHLKELELRIDKLLQSSYVPQTHLRLSQNYSLDLENEILMFHGESQTLSERHLKIIILLANNRNRVVDYFLFQEYAWDGMEVEIPTIRAEINRLKKLLKEDIIINIRNMGYIIKKPI
jgi:DNA-binding response OmpR family regulator